MGLDRQRIVDNFYPEGSVVASHFTPCAIPGGCDGEEWYEFDPAAAKKLLAEAGFPNGFDTELSYRDVVRGYLPEPGLVAQDIQAQLKENLGITVKIKVMESGAFLDAAETGAVDPVPAGLGRGLPRSDQLPGLPLRRRRLAAVRRRLRGHHAVLEKAASLSDQAERNKLYAEANNLIKQHVPMVPVAHGGSGDGLQGRRHRRARQPAGQRELRGHGSGRPRQLVWMQNAEPIGLYCADETDGESLRACEQINEALLSYKIGGTAVEPGAGREVRRQRRPDRVDLQAARGRQVPRWQRLDAKDVVVSFAAQWDAANPLHKGRNGVFTYFPGLFGAFLNAPPVQ